MSDIKDKILPLIGKDNFLEEFYNLYCLYRKDLDNKDGFIQEIISLHNNNLLNIVREFNKLNNNTDTSKVDFFLCRHIFGDILPFITADIEDVLNCVKHLILEAGSDLAAGELITPFEKFCKTNIIYCEELLKKSLDSIDDQIDFITIAIVAGSHLQLEKYMEKAIELCSDKNIIVQKRALFSLGRINYQSNNELIDKVFNKIESIIIDENKVELYPNILLSIISLYKQNNDLERKVIKLCFILIEKENDLLFYYIAEILFREKKALSKDIYNILLKALIKVNPNNIGTLDYIDHILYDLLRNGVKEDLYSFLEELLIKNNSLSICIFNSFVNELINNKQNVLNELVTRWFLSKRIVLGKALSRVIETSVDNNLILSLDSKQLIGLPEGIYVFLARKACGWFFYTYISAVSYIVSLIDFSTDKELEEIKSLLFNPLLMSYPYKIKEYFEELLQLKISGKTKKVINDLLEQLELFHKSLNDNENIPELLPSLSQREEYYRYHSNFMDKVYKEADKKSIINQLVTRKTILYGNSSIYYRYNNLEGSKTREVMPFQHFSHKIDYPSLEYLDPHSLNYNLRIFKIECCHEINN